MESKFPLPAFKKRKDMSRMIKNSLAAFIGSLILALAIISCGKKDQHYIEEIIETMEKGGTP